MNNNFIDDLSKRMANTVSRRDMLRVASRTFFATFLGSTRIARAWAQVASTTGYNFRGLNSCGAVQKSVQLSVGNYNADGHGNLQTYIDAVALPVVTALEAQLINDECAGCILNQFRTQTTVAKQTSCGPIIVPSSICTAPGAPDLAGQTVSTSQIHAASILALSAAPNAFADGSQFLIWSNLTQEILGCLLGSTVLPSLALPVKPDAAATASATCAYDGVNYCGPGNSVVPTFPGIPLPVVAACLNEQCCQHDNCYAKNCESFGCYFTPQTALCDAPLIAACRGQGPNGCSFSDLASGWTAAICAFVTCATTFDPTSPLCYAINTSRLALAPQCLNPCNDSCCASGTTCTTGSSLVPGSIEGLCCPPRSSVCGNTCCALPGICRNGSCTTNSCAACAPQAVCCENGTSTPFCGDPGETCCGTVGLCPAGWVCCGTGSNAGCGAPGSTCCTSREGVSFSCAPGGVCCGDKCADVCCAEDVNGADFGCPSISPTCCGSGSNLICCGPGNCCGSTSTGPSCLC